MVNNLTKVFIKITSWLLGRPSGTPDMVFGVKDGAIVKGVFMSQITPMLEELPDADAEKAGRKFILAETGEEWTYARAGQFGTLEAGTPWPVKGYKELMVLISQSGTDTPTFNVIKDSLLPGTGETLSMVRGVAGVYQLRTQNNLNADFSGGYISYSNIRGFTPRFIRTSFTRVGPPHSRIEIDTKDIDGNTVDAGTVFTVGLKLYPPTS